MDEKNSANSNPSIAPVSDVNSPVHPAPQEPANPAPNIGAPSLEPQQKPAEVSSDAVPHINPAKPAKPKRKRLKKLLLASLLFLFFAGSVGGAYLWGKSNEKIVEKVEEVKLINLPPQAVLLEECVVGRGKQYILPKDIPKGPIYDVVNSKVVALEFNLNLAEIESNPDSLSNAILELAREYPVDHFSLLPAPGKEGEGLKNILLIMFVVSKDEASAITCA